MSFECCVTYFALLELGVEKLFDVNAAVLGPLFPVAGSKLLWRHDTKVSISRANPPAPSSFLLLSRHALGRVWFNIGVVCFSVNVVILAYLTVWLPHVRGIRVSWNVYSPRAIPTATVVGVICALA